MRDIEERMSNVKYTSNIENMRSGIEQGSAQFKHLTSILFTSISKYFCGEYSTYVQHDNESFQNTVGVTMFSWLAQTLVHKVQTFGNSFEGFEQQDVGKTVCYFEREDRVVK